MNAVLSLYRRKPFTPDHFLHTFLSVKYLALTHIFRFSNVAAVERKPAALIDNEETLHQKLLFQKENWLWTYFSEDLERN